MKLKICIQHKRYFLLAFLLVTFSVVYITHIKLDKLSSSQELRANYEIQRLNQSQTIQNLALQTLYFDEVLTQSARNYAFTGDVNWKIRYRIN